MASAAFALLAASHLAMASFIVVPLLMFALQLSTRSDQEERRGVADLNVDLSLKSSFYFCFISYFSHQQTRELINWRSKDVTPTQQQRSRPILRLTHDY